MKKWMVIGALFLCGHVAGQNVLPPAHVLESAPAGATEPTDTIPSHVLQRSTHLTDALRGLTGIQLRDYGGLGGLKTVNIRSLGSEHTGVFIDGIPVDNAQNMQVDLGRFAPEMYTRVQVYNGQRDALLQGAREYGSSAVLYLESAPPLADGRPWRLSVRMTAGPFVAAQPSIILEKCLGRVTARLSGGAVFSNGQYPFHVQDTRIGPDGTLTGYDTVMVRRGGDLRSLRAEGQLFGRGWRLHGYVYGSDRGLPGPVFKRAGDWPQSRDRQRDLNSFLQGGGRWAIGQRNTLEIKGKYSYDDLTFRDYSEYDATLAPAEFRYRQHQIYLSAADAQDMTSWWKISLAADFQMNALQSNLPHFVQPRRYTGYAAFSNLWVFRRLKATASLLYTRLWDISLAGKSSRQALSPFVSVHVRMMPGWTLEGFAKRSFRMPSFNDLYYTTVGNASLRPEDAWQFQLGSAWAGGPWQLRGAVYHNRITDKIIAVPAASQFRWSMYNIAQVRILGAEVRAGYSRQLGPHAVSATLRYTFQKARNAGDSPWAGHQIPYIPVHSGQADIHWGFRGWSADLCLAAWSERFSSQANLPAYRLAPVLTLDASLSREWPLGPGSLSVSLQGRNLTGSRYEMVKGYPMPLVQGLLSLGYRL